jgi:hypothetical protein
VHSDNAESDENKRWVRYARIGGRIQSDIDQKSAIQARDRRIPMKAPSSLVVFQLSSSFRFLLRSRISFFLFMFAEQEDRGLGRSRDDVSHVTEIDF